MGKFQPTRLIHQIQIHHRWPKITRLIAACLVCVFACVLLFTFRCSVMLKSHSTSLEKPVATVPPPSSSASPQHEVQMGVPSPIEKSLDPGDTVPCLKAREYTAEEDDVLALHSPKASDFQESVSDQGVRPYQSLAKCDGEDFLSKGKLIRDKRIPPTPTLSLSVLRDAPSYRQKHALSCEAASLWMVFRYFGLDVTEDQLVEEIGFDPTPLQRLEDGRVIWGDPNEGYVGNIDGWQLFASPLDIYSPDERPLEMWGYGVYQDPLIRVAKQYRFQALKISRIDQIYEYLEQAWLIIVFVPCRGRTQAVVWEWYTPDGKSIRVMNGEHAVVVKGYDDSYIYVEDSSRKVTRYSRPDFELAWNHLRMGIAVRPKVDRWSEEVGEPPPHLAEF